MNPLRIRLANSITNFKNIPFKATYITLICTTLFIFIDALLLNKYFLKNYTSFTYIIIFLFLISIIFICYSIFYNIYKKEEPNQFPKNLIRTIQKLEENEKAILREFYITNEETILIPISDIVASNMLTKRILLNNKKYRNTLFNNMVYQPISINSDIRNYSELKTIIFNTEYSSDKINLELLRPEWADKRN